MSGGNVGHQFFIANPITIEPGERFVKHRLFTAFSRCLFGGPDQKFFGERSMIERLMPGEFEVRHPGHCKQRTDVALALRPRGEAEFFKFFREIDMRGERFCLSLGYGCQAEHTD